MFKIGYLYSIYGEGVTPFEFIREEDLRDVHRDNSCGSELKRIAYVEIAEPFPVVEVDPSKFDPPPYTLKPGDKGYNSFDDPESSDYIPF